jgi:tape measure domain-containing protein
MKDGLQLAIGLSTAGFTGPLGMAKSALGGFLGVASNIGNITTGLASAKGLIGDLVGALNQPIGLAAEMESITAETGILAGSAQRAASLIKDVKQLAAASPMETGGLMANVKTLMGFGVAVEEVMPSLRMLTDIAGSSQARMDGLTLAFAQIASAGRMTGQDLLQLINAGFNPLNEISRTTGKTMADLRKDMEAGSISAQMVEEAFRSATSKGGLFFGNTAAQAETFRAKTATLSDAWDNLQRAFAEPIMLSLKPLLEDASKLLHEWPPIAKEFGQAIGTAVAGVRGLFQSGELGSTLGIALQGASQIFLGNISTGIGAAVQLLGVGIKTAFSSGVALLGDGNFWKALLQSALGITHAVRAALLDTVASMIDKLPTAFQFGADTQGLRDMASSARGASMSARGKAEDAFAQVDWNAVMSPVTQGVAEGGKIIGDAFAQVRASVVNNPALREAAQAVADAGKTAPGQSLRDYLAQASRAGGDMFLAGGRSGRAFVPTAEGGYSAPALPLNTARLDEIMGRPSSDSARGSSEKWLQKLYENGKGLLDEMKALRNGTDPAGAFI